MSGTIDRLGGVWRYRELLRSLVVRNLKVKYQRSLLGFVWTLVNPLFTVAVLGVVFGAEAHLQESPLGEVPLMRKASCSCGGGCPTWTMRGATFTSRPRRTSILANGHWRTSFSAAAAGKAARMS